MEINRDNMQRMRPQIEAALEALGKELGIKFSLGNGKYDGDGNNGSFKLEMATVTEDGTAMTKERTNFQRYCRMFGLLPTDIDREVTISGQRLRIAGLKVNSRVRPIIMAEVGSKNRLYTYPVEIVTAVLQKQYPERADEKRTGYDPDMYDGSELTEVDPPTRTKGFQLQTNHK